MRCKSASPGGVIFYVSGPQKKSIQPFRAAEATNQGEKGMLDRLTLGRKYMESHVTKCEMEKNTCIQTREISEKSNTRR